MYVVVILSFLLLNDLEIETIALSRINKRIESTVNRGQRVRLDCSMIFGVPLESLRDITFIWLANNTIVSNDAKFVIIANSDEEYVCVAERFVGKGVLKSAFGSINITVTGINYLVVVDYTFAAYKYYLNSKSISAIITRKMEQDR